MHVTCLPGRSREASEAHEAMGPYGSMLGVTGVSTSLIWLNHQTSIRGHEFQGSASGSILKYPRFWDSSPKYRRAVTRSFFCEDPSNERKQRQGISAKVGRCKKLPLRGCDSCNSWAKMVVTCCDMPSPSISRPRLVRYHPCNAQT